MRVTVIALAAALGLTLAGGAIAEEKAKKDGKDSEETITVRSQNVVELDVMPVREARKTLRSHLRESGKGRGRIDRSWKKGKYYVARVIGGFNHPLGTYAVDRTDGSVRRVSAR